MQRSRFLGFLLAAIGALPGQAQPNPEGGQFQVNAYTPYAQHATDVAATAGGFVVVWESFGSSGGDTSSYSIQLQRFAVDGSPQGSQVQVNAFTTNEQVDPAVAIGGDGSFVVVWESDGSYGGDGSDLSIQARGFAADGTPVAPQFQVNVYTTGLQTQPDVARAANGNFVVVWTSSASDDDPGYSVQGRRFAADGTPLGPQFQVNTYTPSFQITPAVAIESGGGFVVVWASGGSPGNDGASESIQGRRFAANGGPLGPQFQVNSYTTGQQFDPDVAVTGDGGFVVVWGSEGSAGGDIGSLSIQGRHFAPDGAPSGPDFQVNADSTGWQISPRVAAADTGSFVVVWASETSNQGDPDRCVQGRRFALGGGALGPDFLVNSYTTEYQRLPAVAGTPSGDLVVAWESWGSFGTDVNWSIQAQRYRVDLFVDGFESGTTDEWSDVQP